MFKSSTLSKRDVKAIRYFAEQKRGENSLGKGPIGESIFKLVRDLGIQLIYTPIQVAANHKDNFCGCYVSFLEANDVYRFIGLNTNECLDKQYFIIAHELYHHWVDSSQRVCRNLDEVEENNTEEDKANLFAAEFLLPSSKLSEEVYRATKLGDEKISDWDYSRLLTFIARLHCDYQLPYKAIVRSLFEAGEVTEMQLRSLLQESHRNPDSLYFQIGKRINAAIFKRLNEPTVTDGTDGDLLFEMKLLYDEGIVSLKELSDDLKLFDRTLDDVQLEEAMDEESAAEIEELLKELEG